MEIREKLLDLKTKFEFEFGFYHVFNMILDKIP